MNTHHKSGEDAPSDREAIEYIKQQHPSLNYKEIEDYDRALDDYLNLCREIYWDRVKDGTFPWPAEDSTL